MVLATTHDKACVDDLYRTTCSEVSSTLIAPSDLLPVLQPDNNVTSESFAFALPLARSQQMTKWSKSTL